MNLDRTLCLSFLMPKAFHPAITKQEAFKHLLALISSLSSLDTCGSGKPVAPSWTGGLSCDLLLPLLTLAPEFIIVNAA